MRSNCNALLMEVLLRIFHGIDTRILVNEMVSTFSIRVTLCANQIVFQSREKLYIQHIFTKQDLLVTNYFYYV